MSSVNSIFKKSVRPSLPALILFGSAFLIRLSFNFCSNQPNSLASCDAYEYISISQALIDSGLLSLDPKMLNKYEILQAIDGENLSTLKGLSQCGPVFPLFIAVCGFLTCTQNDLLNSQWGLVLGNCLVSSASVVLIAKFTSMVASARAGCVAGVIAACYPGYVINSGRMYTETFAAFLLCAITYLLLLFIEKNGLSKKAYFLTGLLTASLQFTRPVMLLLTILAIGLLFMPPIVFQRKSESFSFAEIASQISSKWLPYLIGFLTVAVPWWFVESILFQRASLIIDRQFVYNLFIGNNVDIGGWLSDPFPDSRQIQTREIWSLLSDLIFKSPMDWLTLLINKPFRMFKFPWNDFRSSIGPLTFYYQTWIHCGLIYLSMIGLFFCTSSQTYISDHKKQSGLILIGLIISIHSAYLFFITIPRYNLTAMFAVIVFASLALDQLMKMVEIKESRKLGIALVCSLLFLIPFFNTSFLPLLDHIFHSAELCFRLNALVNLLLASAVIHLLGLVAVKMGSRTKMSEMLLTAFALCAVASFSIPLRVHGRTFEWSTSLLKTPAYSIRESVSQELLIPIEHLTPDNIDAYVLLDLSRVRQLAQGWSLTLNGQVLTGVNLPSLFFAHNSGEIEKLKTNFIQSKEDFVWKALADPASIDLIDLRQWSVLRIPATIVSDALQKARRNNNNKAKFTFTIKSDSITDLTVFGTYDFLNKEVLVPSPKLYSWEKTFYGVENRNDFCDTRYDFLVKKTNHPYAFSSTLPKDSKVFLNVAMMLSPGQARETANDIPLRFQAQNKDTASRECKISLSPSRNCKYICFEIHNAEQRKPTMPFAVEVTAEYLDTEGGFTTSSKSLWTPKNCYPEKLTGAFSIVSPLKTQLSKHRLSDVRVLLTPQRGQELPNMSYTLTEFYSNPLLDGSQFY